MKSVSSPLSQLSVLTVSHDYHCSLPLINSLLSEILCVWKFFSNPRSDCHDSFLLGALWFQVWPFQSITQRILPPPSFLPSSTLVTPSWSHWKESPSPVRTCLGSLWALSMPPPPQFSSDHSYPAEWYVQPMLLPDHSTEDALADGNTSWRTCMYTGPEMLGGLWYMPGHKDLGIQKRKDKYSER